MLPAMPNHFDELVDALRAFCIHGRTFVETSPRDAFFAGWRHLHPHSDLTEPMWVLTFGVCDG